MREPPCALAGSVHAQACALPLVPEAGPTAGAALQGFLLPCRWGSLAPQPLCTNPPWSGAGKVVATVVRAQGGLRDDTTLIAVDVLPKVSELFLGFWMFFRVYRCPSQP